MAKLGMLLMGGKPLPSLAGKEEDESEEGYGTAGKRLATRELMAALKKGDEEGVCEALSAFVECCGEG